MCVIRTLAVARERFSALLVWLDQWSAADRSRNASKRDASERGIFEMEQLVEIISTDGLEYEGVGKNPNVN